MQEREDVEDHIPVVGEPEGLEGVASGILGGKYEHHDGDQCQHKGRKTCGEEGRESVNICTDYDVTVSNKWRETIGKQENAFRYSFLV